MGLEISCLLSIKFPMYLLFYGTGRMNLDGGKSISWGVWRDGPWNRDFFGPWNGNERSECHLGPKSQDFRANPFKRPNKWISHHPNPYVPPPHINNRYNIVQIQGLKLRLQGRRWPSADQNVSQQQTAAITHFIVYKYKRGCQSHEGPNFFVCEFNRFTSIKVQIFLWVSLTDLFNGGAEIFLWVSLTDLFNEGPDFCVDELNRFIQWRSKFSCGRVKQSYFQWRSRFSYGWIKQIYSMEVQIFLRVN